MKKILCSVLCLSVIAGMSFSTESASAAKKNVWLSKNKCVVNVGKTTKIKVKKAKNVSIKSKKFSVPKQYKSFVSVSKNGIIRGKKACKSACVNVVVKYKKKSSKKTGKKQFRMLVSVEKNVSISQTNNTSNNTTIGNKITVSEKKGKLIDTFPNLEEAVSKMNASAKGDVRFGILSKTNLENVATMSKKDGVMNISISDEKDKIQYSFIKANTFSDIKEDFVLSLSKCTVFIEKGSFDNPYLKKVKWNGKTYSPQELLSSDDFIAANNVGMFAVVLFMKAA